MQLLQKAQHKVKYDMNNGQQCHMIDPDNVPYWGNLIHTNMYIK